MSDDYIITLLFNRNGIDEAKFCLFIEETANDLNATALVGLGDPEVFAVNVDSEIANFVGNVIMRTPATYVGLDVEGVRAATEEEEQAFIEAIGND